MLYDFYCQHCNKVYEIKMTLAEHSVQKNILPCQECNDILQQKVAKLNFELKGTGWFPKRHDEYDPAFHGLDQGDFAKNLDLEKRIEDESYNLAEKDSAISEI